MTERLETVLNVVVACVATAFFVAVLAYLVLQPYFEYRAYNKATGASKNYWDAVVLELKVPKSAGANDE